MTDVLKAALQAYVRHLDRESKSGLTENLAGYSEDQVKALRKLLRDPAKALEFYQRKPDRS